jgi:iron(III) transport system permease protein
VKGSSGLAWLEAAMLKALLVLAVAVIALPLVGLVLPLLSPPPPTPAGATAGLAFSSRQLTLLVQSFLFSAMVTTVTSLVGSALAVTLHRSTAGRSLLTLILPPLIAVPPPIHGMNWSVTLMSGTEWFSRHGFTSVRPDGWFAAGLAQVLAYLPVAIAVGWAASAMLDVRLLEAGSIYGSEPRVLAGISLRLALPVLLCGACVVFLLSLSDYAVPSFFSVNVFALEIFSIYSTGFHPAAAVWTAAPLMAIVALILVAGLPLVRRAEAMTRSPRASPVPLDRGGRAYWGAVALLVYFSLPLMVVAITAGSGRAVVMTASNARSEIGVTLIIALSTAVLCIVLGQAVSRALDHAGPISASLLVLIAVAFALPAPLTGIGILQIDALTGGLEDGLALWAHTVRFLPMAVLVSYALRRRAEHGLIEAGQVFARSRLHALSRVTLPLMIPGLIVLAAICFSFSMGELGATLLVAAPGHATLMMRLYNLLHYGASREVAALCLLLTLPALVAGVLLTVALRYQAKRTEGEAGHV